MHATTTNVCFIFIFVGIAGAEKQNWPAQPFRWQSGHQASLLNDLLWFWLVKLVNWPAQPFVFKNFFYFISWVGTAGTSQYQTGLLSFLLIFYFFLFLKVGIASVSQYQTGLLSFFFSFLVKPVQILFAKLACSNLYFFVFLFCLWLLHCMLLLDGLWQ